MNKSFNYKETPLHIATITKEFVTQCTTEYWHGNWMKWYLGLGDGVSWFIFLLLQNGLADVSVLRKLFNCKYIEIYEKNILFIWGIITMLLSCNSDYDKLASEIENTNLMEIKEVHFSNLSALSALKTYIKNGNIESRSILNESVKFDSDKIKEYNIIGSKLNFYFVPQMDYDNDGLKNVSAGYIMDGSNVKTCMIIEEELIGEKEKKMTFYNVNHKPIVQITIDGIKKTIVAENYIEPNRIISRSEVGTSQGDCVARCISSVYTEQGWMSVVLWCATAYCPEVAIASALWCNEKCKELRN